MHGDTRVRAASNLSAPAQRTTRRQRASERARETEVRLRRSWERSANRVIEADLSISLTRLCPEGGTRLHRRAVQRFAERTVTGCNWHAPDFPAEITGEAKTIDHLVALIEVRPTDERWCEALVRQT